METPDQRMSPDPDAEPIVENERRGRMSDRERAPRRISGKVTLMADEPRAPKGGKNRMDPVPERADRKVSRTRTRGELPAQLEPRAARSAAEEGYLRVRVRVEDGELSVEDIRAVEGPLVTNEALHGDLAYEVTMGGRRLSSGSIPDAGMMRSFPPLEPAEGQEGHFFTPATSYEFVVRIPKDAVSIRSLPRLNVTLFRIKEPVPLAEGPEPLGDRFPKELHEVGRIRGIRIEHLPKHAQADARRALR